MIKWDVFYLWKDIKANKQESSNDILVGFIHFGKMLIINLLRNIMIEGMKQ